jgi:hypothetical protein
MRPGAEITDGEPERYIPQECEHFGFNELGGLDAAGLPHCSSYVDTLDIECLAWLTRR